MFSKKNNCLVAEFKFGDFTHALNFVNQIGVLAEKANHHPDISFGWGYVGVSLTTHSEGGVTAKDQELAKEIEDEFQKTA